MKILNKILLVFLSGTMLYSCYDSMEIDTTNIGKVEIPIKIAAPLMDGSFVLEFDSFFNAKDLGEDLISYEDGKAFFKYDTLIDFQDELADFLVMEDIDFGNASSFRQSFNLDFEMGEVAFEYQDNITVNTIAGPVIVPVDTTIVLNPQDTFKTKYGSNSIFVLPSDEIKYRLEVLHHGDPIDLGLPFEVYRVDVASGVVNLFLESSILPFITDSYMLMQPSSRVQKNTPPLVLDTTLSKDILIPIYKEMPELPEGINVIAEVKIPSLRSVAADVDFDKRYVLSSLDTGLVIELSDYYYHSDGDGLLDLDVQVYLEVISPKDTAMIPLPDTLYFGASIKDLAFNHVIFNYGLDTAMSGSQDINFDVFSDFPDHIEIEGFRLSNPEIKLKVESNLGFTSFFNIDSLLFTTDGAPEFITTNAVSMTVSTPNDPFDASVYIPVGRDSIHLDSASSRLEEVELLNVNGLHVSYDVIINPDDRAGEFGMHNFFYDYSSDDEDGMYDVTLSAEMIIPFKFKFEKIQFQETMAFAIADSDIDSMIYLSDNDSVILNVKMLTKDFPFEAKAQFYFDEIGTMGTLIHLDSMFNAPRVLLPSSSDGVWDSTEWSLLVDADKYESIKATDSLTFEITLSMDENDYFQLEEGYTTEIGYKFSIGESSFVVKQSGTDD